MVFHKNKYALVRQLLINFSVGAVLLSGGAVMASHLEEALSKLETEEHQKHIAPLREAINQIEENLKQLSQSGDSSACLDTQWIWDMQDHSSQRAIFEALNAYLAGRAREDFYALSLKESEEGKLALQKHTYLCNEVRKVGDTYFQMLQDRTYSHKG